MMMTQFSKLSALLLSLALAACGGSPGPGAGPTGPKPAAADPSCPVEVAGTSVTVEDTATGAAFVFVTTGDVAGVRQRAAALAQMHNDHHGKMGPLPDGTGAGGGHDHGAHDHGAHGAGAGGGSAAGDDEHGSHHLDKHAHGAGGHSHGAGGHDHGGHDHGGHGGAAGPMGHMIGVHSKAASSDVEGGAKVTFVANGGDVAKLQGELRMHAQHLAAGTCAMGKS